MWEAERASRSDRLLSELKERFPPQLTDFAFLEPRHYNAVDAQERVCVPPGEKLWN